MTGEPDNIALHYQGVRGEEYHLGKRGIPALAVPWVAKSRHEKLSPYVKPADVVFEFGAGAGWNLLMLKCKEKIAFDISEHAVEQLQKQDVRVIRGMDELKPGSINVVICHHALEHVPNPFEVLEQLRCLLHQDGRLLLFVPFEKERRYRWFNRAEPNHHLFSWNVQTMGNLVTEAGYEVLDARVARFGYDRFAAKWACRYGLGERGFRIIRGMAHLVQPLLEVRVVARPFAN